MNTPSTEERLWAVLSHLSAVAFGAGLLLPIIGWSEQRRKSKYASFQCLQALGYQSLGYTVWMLSYLVVIIFLVLFFSILLTFTSAKADRLDPFAMAGFNIILIVLIVGGFGLYFLFPVIAAISCAIGRDFRYPVMGNRLARYLGYDPVAATDEPTWLIEEHEDRWVSAMGHISVIIPLWGLLAPATAWVMQGRRSVFLKFQSMQTALYQVLVNGLNLGAVAIYMVGFILFISLTGFERGMQSSTGMVGIVALGGSMLIAMVMVLIIPLFHILGQWAGYRILKGDDYHYPLVGKLVERWQHTSDVRRMKEQQE